MLCCAYDKWIDWFCVVLAAKTVRGMLSSNKYVLGHCTAVYIKVDMKRMQNLLSVHPVAAWITTHIWSYLFAANSLHIIMPQVADATICRLRCEFNVTDNLLPGCESDVSQVCMHTLTQDEGRWPQVAVSTVFEAICALGVRIHHHSASRASHPRIIDVFQ